MTRPTPGQLAYQEDVRRCPQYHDGTPRKAWSQLCEVAKWSWERNPVPRNFARLEEAAQ